MTRCSLAAVAYADREGLGSLSMRRLGEELGVEAMSLYTYVSGKDDLLDGMVDIVFGEIDVPAPARAGATPYAAGPSRRARCCTPTPGRRR